jgi:hypothetical protein
MKTLLLTILPLALFASCGSTTTTYDPDAGGLRTVDSVNYNDFTDAAGVLIQSMLESGMLNESGLSKHDDGRVILALEDVDNMTSSNIKTKILTDKVRIALNKTGRVLTTTAVKFGSGGPEDTGTKEVRDINDPMFEQNEYRNASSVVLPDLSLSGSIIKMGAEEGRTKETVLVFKLTMTDLRTGLAIWEDEAPIGKRRTKGIFGG